ncbi:MAG: inorganic phosphate transporter [Christensenellaceae bacterium]|nr:inorganic phosphate transporter [Christensenellaceae bacterium]
MGFNDGSNALATTVATRAIKPNIAVITTAITKFSIPILVYIVGVLFHISGFTLADNISKKTIYFTYFFEISQEKAFSFLFAGVIAAIIWGGIAYTLKVPNSTSHTLLGAIIGSGIAAFGFQAIQWKEYVGVNIVLMVALAPIITLIIAYLFMKLVRKLMRHAHRGINNVFMILQRINLVLLASTFSLNNSQKALSVFMMIGMLGLSEYSRSSVPFWAVLVISVSLAAGVMLGGYRVINTVGRKIFRLQPVHSVAAQVSTSLLMLIASQLGISVSTGQVMSSAVIGVGAAEKLRHVQWNMALRIVISWALTLPIAASLGAVVYLFVSKVIFKV